MEVRDGFIVGIFNYCDRWCETCAFTSRCRVFADVARMHASLDPNLKAITDAPLLPQDEPPPPPKWMEDLIEEMNEASRKPLTEEELRECAPKYLPGHEAISARAEAYSMASYHWLRDRDDQNRPPTDPISIIAWFSLMIHSKVHRALTGLAEFDGNREFPPDHEGSAKVALIGIERSLAAWRELISGQAVTEQQARPFVEELEWLLRRLDETIPMARGFVRPGFDEPFEVARLKTHYE
jgi:hypothetical protein